MLPAALLILLSVLSPTDYRALFEKGVAYSEFLDAAERRRDMWLRNSDAATVSNPLLDRATRAVREAGGPIHILAVAVDGCSDSANTLPYIAALVRAVDGVDLRIIDATDGAAIMASHRTPDGRPATPTVVVLDADFKEIGVFVERPTPLEDWLAALDPALSDADRLDRKFAWYDVDAGQSTQEELVAIMESAALPAALNGLFQDDYGASYVVSSTAMIQDDRSVYHILEWNAAGQFAIAQNDRGNPYAPGLWSRMDWMLLPDTTSWTWAFCLSAWNAESADEARSADSANRSEPKTGCFGHPFTRMQPQP